MLFSPALKDNEFYMTEAKALLKVVGNIIPKIAFMPKERGKSNLNAQCDKFYKNDEYSYNGKFVTGTGKTMMDMILKCPQTFKDYDCPFLVVQGGVDKLINAEGAKDLYE